MAMNKSKAAASSGQIPTKSGIGAKGLGKALGKGLDLLISSEYVQNTAEEGNDSESENESPVMIKMRLIESNNNQPRNNFNEDSLQELADSIKQYGILQPLILQKQEDHYLIIAGERRWRAAKLAGLKEVPAVIKEYSDQEIAEVSLIENLQREDLNPIEEALAYQVLIDKYGLKQEEISERVAKSRSVITNALRLLKLNDQIREMLIEGLISTGHAKALLGLPDPAMQQEVADKILDEQLSVRETEKLVKNLTNKKEKIPKKKIDLPDSSLYTKIEEKMKNRIGTQVRIKRKDVNQGKIEIDYYTNDDLEKIMALLGVNE